MNLTLSNWLKKGRRTVVRTSVISKPDVDDNDDDDDGDGDDDDEVGDLVSVLLICPSINSVLMSFVFYFLTFHV